MKAKRIVPRPWMVGCILGVAVICAAAASVAESLALTCLDQTTRAPVAGAKVAATVDTTLTYYVTDERGMCEIPLPEGGPRSLVALTLNADAHVPVVVEWRVGSRPIPDKHTVLLEPGAVIGGTILNAREEPIPNALVHITVPMTESAGNQVLIRDHTERAGPDGKWTCGIVPSELTAVQLQVEVLELSLQQVFRYGQGGRALEPLRDLSDRLVLEERGIVYGGVVDPDGKPVGGATVAVWLTDALWRSARLATTDAWGRFRVTGCPPGNSTILVRAPGWAPLLEHAAVAMQQPSRTFVTQPGTPLRIRVVDAAGEPLPGAWVTVDSWRGLEGLLDWQAFANGSGEVLWEDAPNEGISLVAEAAGAQPSTLTIPHVKDETYTIRIGSAVRVRGQVLEEGSGAPIAAFEATPGIRYPKAETVLWLSSRRIQCAGGAFSFTLPRDDTNANFVKITAPGHAPWISAEIPSERDEFELTAELEPAAPLNGRVVDAGGKPVQGAFVHLCTPSDGLYLRNGRVASEFLGFYAETGADGEFELSPELPPFCIAAVCGNGAALLSNEDWAAGRDVTIMPWSSLRGQVQYGEEVLHNRAFRMALCFKKTGVPMPFFEYQGKTDDHGNFELDGVPCVECQAVFEVAMPDGSAFQWPTETLILQAETPADVSIGGTGQAVRGTVPLPEETIATPPQIIMCTIQQRTSCAGQEGPVFQARTPVSADGTFCFPDVPPGSYVASVAMPKASSEEEGETAFDQLRLAFEVPVRQEGGAAEPVDLGEMVPPAKAALTIGEPVPDIDAHLLDGAPVSLKQYEGRFLLVDVWATWCGPCQGETPYLKKVFEEFGGDPRFAMLGISLDAEKERLTDYLERENIRWPQVFASEAPGLDLSLTWGIDAIPAILLIGPDGTLVAQHLRGDAIGIAVRQVLSSSEDTEERSDE